MLATNQPGLRPGTVQLQIWFVQQADVGLLDVLNQLGFQNVLQLSLGIELDSAAVGGEKVDPVLGIKARQLRAGAAANVPVANGGDDCRSRNQDEPLGGFFAFGSHGVPTGMLAGLLAVCRWPAG